MTGLDLTVDELVEVAVVITDYDLVPLDPGFTIVIKPDQSALDNMNEFVTNMHTSSGLINEIPNELIGWIQSFVGTGNSSGGSLGGAFGGLLGRD